MRRRWHVTTTTALVSLALAGCAGGDGLAVDQPGSSPTPTESPIADADPDVLSACVPADTETIVLLEAGDPPPAEQMEAAIGGNPDLQHAIDEADEDQRLARLHDMYGQVVGETFLEHARSFPGFVQAAYARPSQGEPFRLAYSGDVPEGLDLDAHDLGSFGLEVTTGAPGFDEDATFAAFKAAEEVGIEAVYGSPDRVTGTGTIIVVDATPEQVAAWEALLDDPSRWCMERAPLNQPCDDDVIAVARERADRPGEVIPHEEGRAPTAEEADAVRGSYLGLTRDEAEAKAAEEGRPNRVTMLDGVGLGATDDLRNGRVSFAVCQGVVVDVTLDGEPRP